MNKTQDHLPHRSIRSYLTARPSLELYAWLLAGLLLDVLVRTGGDGFDSGSPWDMGLGLLALASVRTGLARWTTALTRRSR